MNRFAVIWNDFIPLSLHCADANEAIDSAKRIASKGKVRDVRAVAFSLDAADKTLITLWRE